MAEVADKVTKFFAVWFFKDEATAKKAVEEELQCPCSWGEADEAEGWDEQYDGFDYKPETISFSNVNGLCRVEWADNIPWDADMEKYWMSPYCFENYETFSKDGKPLKGEQDDFGTK